MGLELAALLFVGSLALPVLASLRRAGRVQEEPEAAPPVAPALVPAGGALGASGLTADDVRDLAIGGIARAAEKAAIEGEAAKTAKATGAAKGSSGGSSGGSSASSPLGDLVKSVLAPPKAEPSLVQPHFDSSLSILPPGSAGLLKGAAAGASPFRWGSVLVGPEQAARLEREASRIRSRLISTWEEMLSRTGHWGGQWEAKPKGWMAGSVDSFAAFMSGGGYEHLRHALYLEAVGKARRPPSELQRHELESFPVTWASGTGARVMREMAALEERTRR